MPSGRKHKNKQRSKRRNKKLLLDKSRRCRDEQVSSVLDETDVMAHISINNSFLLHPRSTSPSNTLYDSIDSSFGDCFDTTFVKSTAFDCISFSTPKKDLSSLFNHVKKTRRSLSTPSTQYLTPITSISDEGSMSDDMFLVCSTRKDSSLETDALRFTWIQIAKCTQDFILSIPNFIFKFCSWFHKLFALNFKMPSNLGTKDLSIVSFKETEETEDSFDLSASHAKSDQLILSKLNDILSIMSRLESKHDTLLQRVDKIEQNLDSLKKVPLAVTAPPPPPPPPPPPFLPANALLSTPVTRSRPEKKTTALGAAPRPSISLQDILGVQLRKTPKPKSIALEKAVQSNGSRGPLVSVDMLRSVKLKSSQMRRRSIERPLQSPSAVFKVRSP